MPKLTVVDVGHGNAAVLEDSAGVVIVDTGRGTQLLDFLDAGHITRIEALLLSHADTDHMAAAATLINSVSIQLLRVFANPDGSKGSRTWKAFIAAVALARAEGRLELETGVHVGTIIRNPEAEAKIEIVYPPPEALLGGVKSKVSPDATSNNLSVAVRIQLSHTAVVLLGGDVEFGCIDFWSKSKIDVSADAAIFPHHGGAPGEPSRAGLFAYEFTKLVRPAYVVFSIHETMYTLPRSDVVAGILKADAAIRLICTRLPAHVKKAALEGESAWMWHVSPDVSPISLRSGHVTIQPGAEGLKVDCVVGPGL